METTIKNEEKHTSTSIIMFTDIKDFTLKTSLLTNKQVEKVLIDHTNLVTPIVENLHGKVIKVVGDAFMITFQSSQDALACWLSLQKAATIYNQDKKLNLFKIELRISLDKWEVIKTQTLEGDDYFWEAVNMASRLESITPENTILITEKVYADVKNNGSFNIVSMGKTSFRWILYEIEIYKVLFDEREIRNFKSGKITLSDLKWGYKDKYKSIITEADNLIFNCSCVAAILWIQPIPFFDNFSVIPLNVYMLIKIASIYGKEISIDSWYEFLKRIIPAIGASYLALNISLGVTKIFLPLVAGYGIIPINFWITYGLGKIFSMYYYSQNFGVEISNKDMRELFKDKRNMGKNIAQREKNSILEKGRAFQKEIADYLKEITNKIKK